MVRFINLTDQITEGEKKFAFYDTITDKFCQFNGCQTWDSVDDLALDYDESVGEFDRLLNLIPKEFWEETLFEYYGRTNTTGV